MSWCMTIGTASADAHFQTGLRQILGDSFWVVDCGGLGDVPFRCGDRGNDDQAGAGQTKQNAVPHFRERDEDVVGHRFSHQRGLPRVVVVDDVGAVEVSRLGNAAVVGDGDADHFVDKAVLECRN